MTLPKHVEEKLKDLTDPGEEWAPVRIPAGEPEAGGVIHDLVASGRVTRFYDALETQLFELLETRSPADDLTEVELHRRAAGHLGDTPLESYGTWIHYPWSGRLVRVLPEAEYRELRTSRNRNKITADEQATLSKARVGVVGLSVGQSMALTLAMEESVGELRLADFDHLSLSNMNRIRAGVHDVGVNKAVVAARQIFEFNPYARVRLFLQGLDEHNLDAFFDQGGRIDVLLEECDDLYMKVKLREHARRVGVPVVMETSDRGLVDVERFDLEPDRPLLHGLVGGVDPESLRGLASDEKVPIMMRMLGQTTLSPRLAASMVEVKSTLKSWPQLASGIAMGAALATDTVRRILLGQLNDSGRFYVDHEELIADGAGIHIQVASDELVAPEEAERPFDAPVLRATSVVRLTEDQVRALVAYGTMAPSGGNCQPWRFEYDGRRLRCIHDTARSAASAFLDFRHTSSYLAFGAVVENIELAAAQVGFQTLTELFPEGDGDRTVVCDLRFESTHAAPEDTHLFEHIRHRVTNRKLGPRRPLDPELTARLSAAAERHGARLGLVQDESALKVAGQMLGRGDRVRFLSKVMHQEMMSELRWTTEEAERTRDGLDVATLELSGADLAGMRLTRTWGVMDLVGKVGGGRSLEKPSRKAVNAASAVGLVMVPSHAPEDYFRGGRAFQRIWLEATARGYAYQPMTAITYVFARLELAGGEGLSAGELEEMQALHEMYRALFGVREGEAGPMLFRLALAAPPTARALRRRVEDVLTITG